ncbi:hypothetical protein [Prauserella cavernicola]|uniref:LapA family protein n=1 Tax=Prauserella cavernicola TaxID=2800127 RepID=A0A934QRN5_9PSEU|nr:hypothetical protein [Prauserella cavernicola]MBK1785315.1 hypothetical protein [Prauserella cavernicola]
MLWLFGQIWVWLLVSFALGAGLTALLLGGRRRRREPSARSAAPRPTAAEQTGNLPVTGALPAVRRPDRHAEPEPEEGSLPSRRDWHTRNEWPDEQDARDAMEQERTGRGG